MSTRNKEYLELLEHSFNEEKFIKFVIDLLNLDISSLNKYVNEISVIQNQYKDCIDYYKFVANYNDGMNDLGVFIIKLNDTSSTRARIMQRNFVATLLKKYNLDAALVSFFSDKEKTWRLSFVKKELRFTENGVKEELTSAKRYSYLVGEGESIHTAKEYLLHLLDIDTRKITLDDIEKQFDVEKVTKKFFEEYKEKYLQLKEFLDKNEDFQTEAKNCDFNSEEFAKKLMGQIVFLYFLQKKGWLGVQLIPNELTIEEFNDLISENDSVSQNLLKNYYELSDNMYIVEKTKLRISEVQEDIVNLSNIFKNTKYDMPWGSGKKDFIMHIFNQSQKEHKNFFDDYLEYFFYKGLNEKRENQYFPLFNCKIPFLNGGLFEPLNNYRWSSAHFEIKNSLFHNENEDGILDFLNLYNFTIDEEEPLEKDIAVDPEMLGKIFENLLDINERSSKGAFYTPREIVHYMCQESLANYLTNKVGVVYDEILAFIKYGDSISQLDWDNQENKSFDMIIGKSVYDNLLRIDEALFEVKVADPAVGSGAFPLGMLNEIVKLRTNIQTYILIKKELGLLNIEELYGTPHLELDIYKMKLQTIENCIYAVDIEPSAVDIAKLRLWLSLVVDYPNDKEPRPLPNLDCKIMQGNSLIDEYDGVPLFSNKMIANNLKKYHRNESQLGIVEEIKIQQTLFQDNNKIDEYIDIMLNLQKEYFITTDGKNKKDLKLKIDKIQMGLVEESLRDEPNKLFKFRQEALKRKKPWFIWELEFYDVFKKNGGFDIVIGNPPYVSAVSTSKDDLKQREIIRKKYKQLSGAFDLYVAFLLLSTNIGNTNSIYSFIIPNKLLVSDYAKKSVEYLKKNGLNKVFSLSHINVFDSASVYPIIIVGNKNVSDYKEYKVETIEDLNNGIYSEKTSVSSKQTFKSVGIKMSSGATGFQAKSLTNYLSELRTEDSIPFTVSGCVDKYSVGNSNVRYMGKTYSNAYITKGKDIADSKWSFWNSPKIIVAGMTKVIESVYVTNPCALGVGIYGIYDFANYNPLFIVGLLNSKYMSYYLNIMFEEKHLAGGYLAINKSTIEDLPFAKPTKEIEETIARYVQEIMNDKNMIVTNQKKIDDMVYSLFKVDNDTINKIEKFYEDNNLNDCGFGN